MLLPVLLFCLPAISQQRTAKTKPSAKNPAKAASIANVKMMFNRAQSLDKGMNISWLEQT